MGTASVSHHANTHASTANMFRLLTWGPSNLTERQMMAHKRGPERMYKFLNVTMDSREKGELEHGSSIGSLTGRSGVFGSS